MPPHPPELMEELVEEVLLRFPPDDPASLVRAALVCKLWCRLVCGAAFRRRFREFHRGAAPLLGVVYSGDCKLRHDDDAPTDTEPSLRPVRVMPRPTSYLVPTTSFRPLHAADGRRNWRAMDARHGRVLLCQSSAPWHTLPLSIWDPVTDEQRDLPELPLDVDLHGYSAAVTCASAAAAGGGNCDHLDCHSQPFIVVVMHIQPKIIHIFVYSSEAGAWSQLANLKRPNPSYCFFHHAHSVLVGSALYFLVHYNDEIVKFDLATGELSTIRLPPKFYHAQFRSILLMPDEDGEHHDQFLSIVLMTDEDGGLGFAANTKYQLELWSMVDGGNVGFVLKRVIDLQKVLPSSTHINNSLQVNGFVDGGASRLLFMKTSDGLYSIEINSCQVKKVADCCDNDRVVLPYVSFCTPTSRVQV